MNRNGITGFVVALVVGTLSGGCGDSAASETTSGSGGGGAGGADVGSGGSGAGTVDTSWSCVGEVEWPSPQSAEVTVPVLLVEFLSSAVMPGVNMKVCARTDETCAAPLDEQVTGSNGIAELTIPLGKAGFDGYLELTEGGAQPQLWYLNPPILGVPPAPPYTLSVVSEETFGKLAQAGGLAIDPSRGTVEIDVFDCQFAPGVGASLSASTADASSTRFYISGGLPNTSEEVTSATGNGGFGNLPPGPVTITATLADSGVTLTTTAMIRPGYFTLVDLVPTP